MELKVLRHEGPEATGRQMYKSAKFWEDLGELKNFSLYDFYVFVRNIPYENDPSLISSGEIVSRPKYALKARALDCKKKAVLLGAWCNAQKPPLNFKFIASSERPDGQLHHVFPIIGKGKNWIIADATYKKYFLGQGKLLTRFKVL